MWFSTPSSCATFKQIRQSLAPTLCAVSVTQKVISDLPHLFCMQLKASQISWFPKAPRAPALICFRVGFLIVLGFFSAAISSHTHLTSPFMEQLFILFHTRTGHQPFLLSGYCGSTSAGYWQLFLQSKARLRYRSRLSLERRRVMLPGTTFDLLPV